MNPIALDDDRIRDLEHLVLLLDRAGRQLHRAGAQASTGSSLHWLSIGVLLARAQAVELLPEGHKVDDPAGVEDLLDQTFDRILGVGTAGEHSVLQKLRAAEQLTRSDALLDTD